MIELRWMGRQLQYRTREPLIDASGAFCGVSDFGDWKAVGERRVMPPFVKASRSVVSAFREHGIGPEFPELQKAIEEMVEAFEGSIWRRLDC